MKPHPRIAVVGCGALGSFYGARLARRGLDVHFLLRSDYEAVRARGVRIVDADGGFTVRPGVAREPAEIGACDLVVIGLKSTANSEFRRLLEPLVGPETALLTLQNGLGNEAQLAALFGPQRVFGGLCFVCLNRVEPGVIHHLAHGRIVMGEYQRPLSARAGQIARWFQDSGVRCDTVDNLEQAHWEKLVWNIAFNGLGVAAAAGWEAVQSGILPADQALRPCADTQQLLGDPRWAGLVRQLMNETIAAAHALGFPIPPSTADQQITLTGEMGAYRASTLIDFERGLPLELEAIFGEPLRRARAAGVATPRLAALYDVLTALDRRRPGRQ